MGSSECMLRERGRTLNECSCPVVGGLPKVIRGGRSLVFLSLPTEVHADFFSCMTH